MSRLRWLWVFIFNINYWKAFILVGSSLMVIAVSGGQTTTGSDGNNPLAGDVPERSLDTELLYGRALAIREEMPGSERLGLATTLNNLALLRYNQGRYSEAESLYQRALKNQERILGPKHPMVAITLNNLAVLYHDQGRYDKAEPLYQRALTIREEVLGPKNPAVAVVLNNLAALYQDMDRPAQAESLYQRALAIWEERPSGGSADSIEATSSGMQAAIHWVDGEFSPSTLSREEQLKEMEWFIQAAKPFQGMHIRVISETLTTHKYESLVLARAFTEITGIEVAHDLFPEGKVIETLQRQMQTGENLYDAYINDSDLIGTHFRSGKVVPLSDFMAEEARDVTLPTLDIDDFIGKSFTTGPDGKLYQLPDQQFANLYWFRYDWFQREDLRNQFRDIYGYELGVPLNWSAYEDIADFFTHHVKEIDGVRIYGHMDYGKEDPSLGWRFTDAWLSMAGVGDKGLPNGKPVDEWGIRMFICRPQGSSVERGGATNSPAAVFALTQYIDWLKKYAPPEVRTMTFSEAGPVPSQGYIAQQIFWYTTFTADMIKPGLPVVNPDGTPKWRMAPSPHGPYWEKGMKLGYQDAGSWTLLHNTPLERRKAAWLYAQFTVSKSVSLKKTLVGLTPIRESDIQSKAMTEVAPRLGGLVEFYRSPARVAWTPTGINVPDYPELAPLWWQNVTKAVTGELTPQQAMDKLAREQDQIMEGFERIQAQGDCSPRLNEPVSPDYWLRQPGAPKGKLANEKPRGQTIRYEDLLEAWRQGRAE